MAREVSVDRGDSLVSHDSSKTEDKGHDPNPTHPSRARVTRARATSRIDARATRDRRDRRRETRDVDGIERGDARETRDRLR